MSRHTYSLCANEFVHGDGQELEIQHNPQCSVDAVDLIETEVTQTAASRSNRLA
jgi:hypothetical protein